MIQPRVVIVGAGLGGCVLAHALLDTHDVTVVERGDGPAGRDFPVIDVGRPAALDPHVGSGLGGSTKLWHNGLIEIDPAVFESHWPISKQELAPYYDTAFFQLSGVSPELVRKGIAELRSKYLALGLPDAMLPGLFYPRWPVNTWESLGLAGRVNLLRGEVRSFKLSEAGTIASLLVTDEGGTREVTGDVFVLAAGGLGSPVLLQRLAAIAPLPALRHAGCHYEDHPMGFVGDIRVRIPLYRLWNFHVAGTGGNLRMPLVMIRRGMHVSFYLRPAATYYRDSRRQRVGSVLYELRQNPWNPAHYFKLLSHWDDVLDILSFKFGIRLPTRHYTLLMTAQMPTADERSVWETTDPATGHEVTVRSWHLSDEFQADLRAAIDDVLGSLAPVLNNARVFTNWIDDIHSGAHHSGTARMSDSPETGVCDETCRVHGVSNLYVCDGSVIPASGIANTGLTIGALALRLAEHLRKCAPRPSGAHA